VASHSVLVFPAGMSNALTWARHASKNGVRIVGASSLAHDPARGNYPEWISLPWIGEAGFSTALSRCLVEQRIDAIFTSHPIVWSVLRDLLPKVSPDVGLRAGGTVGRQSGRISGLSRRCSALRYASANAGFSG
jgi:hypothetical protein